jgi:hypothetical protein
MISNTRRRWLRPPSPRYVPLRSYPLRPLFTPLVDHRGLGPLYKQPICCCHRVEQRPDLHRGVSGELRLQPLLTAIAGVYVRGCDAAKTKLNYGLELHQASPIAREKGTRRHMMLILIYF